MTWFTTQWQTLTTLGKWFVFTLVLFAVLVSLLTGRAFAASTSLTFTEPVTASVIPSGETDPNDGIALFSGVYDEAGFRVRPNGGIWYVAGDLGDPVGHVFSMSMPGLGQYVSVSRVPAVGALVGGEWRLQSLLVQSLDGKAVTVLVNGQNEDGNVLYTYFVHLPASLTPVTVRLDTLAPQGAFLTPINFASIGGAGGEGIRLLGVTGDVAPVRAIGGGGRRGK